MGVTVKLLSNHRLFKIDINSFELNSIMCGKCKRNWKVNPYSVYLKGWSWSEVCHSSWIIQFLSSLSRFCWKKLTFPHISVPRQFQILCLHHHQQIKWTAMKMIATSILITFCTGANLVWYLECLTCLICQKLHVCVHDLYIWKTEHTISLLLYIMWNLPPAISLSQASNLLRF